MHAKIVFAVVQEDSLTLKQLLHCKENIIPQGAAQHKWLFVLLCGSYLISRFQFLDQLLEDLMGDPCGTLDPELHCLDFYLSHRSLYVPMQGFPGSVSLFS